MDDGELDFSNHETFSGTNLGDIPSSGSVDSFFEGIFKDTHACTHTHACNPPGPDSSHTHTCYHVHTKIVPAMSGDDKTPTDDTAESTEKKGKKRPLGNPIAVRKYREKKKAWAASLEYEVVRLRTLNQRLMKRIQSLAGVEAEVARLKCLLVDIKGRIEGEIGSFPYQKQQPAGQNLANPNLGSRYMLNPCNMQCGDQAYCLHPVADGKTGEGPSLNGCEFENLQCLGNQSFMLNELPGCRMEDGLPVINPCTGTKRKATSR